jgi:hypothetical protein
VLTLHALLALDNKKPDLALEDIKVNYIVLSGAMRDPSLVGGLVAIGMTAISNATIYDGLARHAWSDAQLEEIEEMLKPINFLADFQFAMRCEVVGSTTNLEYFQHLREPLLKKLIGASGSDASQIILFAAWPGGWWDQNKSRMANSVFQSLNNVDPQARLVFPKADGDLQHQIEQANARWDAFAPWKILANISAGPITRATQKYAQAQVWIDEARIACALERYRLAHGVYPGKLDELVPACIDEVPHDILNGEPYRYQLRQDGTFLLYSVGWNQTDDGGKVVFKNEAKTQVDYEQGDWVWPTPKPAKL